MAAASLTALVDNADPDAPALIANENTITYAQLADAVRHTADVLTSRGLRPGHKIAVSATADLDTITTILAAAQLGAAAALINPRLTQTEQRQLTASLDAITADGIAVILFTSGTTGLPKPVPIPTHVLLGRLKPYTNPPRPQVRLVCAPLYHVGGLLGLLVSLAGGHTAVLQPRFDAGEWLRLVQQHRVELTFLVPTMLRRILDHPDFPRTDLSSLTSITYGAAPMPPQLIDRAVEALPRVAFNGTFGQTETLGGITLLNGDDHRDASRRRSVGRPLPGVQIRVEESGELHVRSEQNVASGWHATGDLVRVDADGYLYYLGRVDGLINRGGEKIAPAEVEAVLRTHPAVLDACVIGVPDADLGERVAALVVLVEPADLATWCRQRLAAFKVPEVIKVISAIPYTELGKVDRRAVRDALRA